MDLYTKDNVPWFLKLLNMICSKKFMLITWEQLQIPEWQKKYISKDTANINTSVINCTKAHFACHGIPEICHTNNGPQYISNKFKMFSRTYGFQHTWSAPHYPKGNRRAKTAVKVAKNMLKRSYDFYSALLNYRNMLQQGRSYSSVHRMMNRRTKTLPPTSNYTSSLTHRCK